MQYQINEYMFDSETLVLKKDDLAVDIRHNEAKLLAFLLASESRVVSKDEILSTVWKDRVVAEQAVFQNISNLRAILGSKAIKTYPKRGYQWLMDFEVLQGSGEDVNTVPNEVTVTNTFYTHRYMGVAVMLILTALFIGVLGYDGDSPEQSIEIGYIPFGVEQENERVPLKSSDRVMFAEITDISTDEFIYSIELRYPALAADFPVVLSGYIRSFENRFYLDFLLKGKHAEWQGQLAEDSLASLNEKLVSHLSQPVVVDFVSKNLKPELKLANLSLAHEKKPHDLIVLGHLLESYIRANELDNAMVIAKRLERLASNQGDSLQKGIALMYQSEILTSKDLIEPSARSLKLADTEFKKIQDFRRQADVWEKQSWLDHKNNDYSAIKQSLLKSAQLAVQAQDKARELHALTYLSILASKHRKDEDKYFYLQEAENKMRLYGLPLYHYAKIPFHHAIFVNSPEAKEPHYKQVLEYTTLTPDHWVAQASRRNLVQYYVNKGRYQDAQNIIDNLNSDNAENSFLQLLVSNKNADSQTFSQLAQVTFSKAKLAGNLRISLDVALLICERQEKLDSYEFFAQYIADNSPKYWRDMNKEKLKALNL